MIVPRSWIDAIKKCINLSDLLKAPVVTLNPTELFQPVVKDVFSYFTPSIFIWDPVAISNQKEQVLSSASSLLYQQQTCGLIAQTIQEHHVF